MVCSDPEVTPVARGARRETGEERLAVAYGTTMLIAILRRSPRRRTVALTIDPELGLVVTAPETACRSRLEAIVRKKARWIVGELSARGELEAPAAPRVGRSGESLLYLGRHYRVEARPTANPGPARLRGGFLVVPEEPGPRLCEAVRAWLRGHAGRHLPARAALWSQRLDVSPAALLIREPSRRWGSCNAEGVLRLNWRIIQAPLALVDYVVAHELVHLLHRDHSQEFWRTLGVVMPDYERRRESLRRLGPQLGW